jgi:transcriptional regulator with XRE-family HTH domain
MNYFARNIRFLRTQSGLRQAEMLDKIGVARTTWSSYENNVSQPDIEGLLKIACFFGITVTELLEVDMKAKGTPQSGRAVKQKGRSKRFNATPPGEPVTLTNGLQLDVINAKQQVIETQAQTISALQALIEHLTIEENRFGKDTGQEKHLRSDVTAKKPLEKTPPRQIKAHGKKKG